MIRPQLRDPTTGDVERKLREFLESAPDAILELDREGRIVLLNDMAGQLFGYARVELLGKSVEVLLPDALRDSRVPHRGQYSGAGLELAARRKDGSRFPVEIGLSPVKSDTGFGVTLMVRDISERQQIGDQLRAIQAKYIYELELRNRESERANQLKTEFLSNMSHELRSPLNTIIGFSELLAEETVGPLNEKQKRFIGHMHKDSLHLLDLINDLLDLSKIEAGRLELRPEAFPVDAVIDEALASAGPRAVAKSVEIRANVATSFLISADRLRFHQILGNLLANAIKFTPENGKVWVDALERGGFAEVSVSDTGIGIPEEGRPLIFDKFYQVSAATRCGREGTGLGLAISKALVEQHGGRIWFASEVGKGTCFTFTIPVDPPPLVRRSTTTAPTK